MGLIFWCRVSSCSALVGLQWLHQCGRLQSGGAPLDPSPALACFSAFCHIVTQQKALAQYRHRLSDFQLPEPSTSFLCKIPSLMYFVTAKENRLRKPPASLPHPRDPAMDVQPSIQGHPQLPFSLISKPLL